jgi:hypothetical protein
MRRLPKAMRILGVRYTVAAHAHIEHPEQGLLYGSMEPDTFAISILDLNHVSLERQKQTFLHECLHALLLQAGLDVSFDSTAEEEELVRRLAPALLGLLRDNKAAIAYLQEVQ